MIYSSTVHPVLPALDTSDDAGEPGELIQR